MQWVCHHNSINFFEVQFRKIAGNCSKANAFSDVDLRWFLIDSDYRAAIRQQLRECLGKHAAAGAKVGPCLGSVMCSGMPFWIRLTAAVPSSIKFRTTSALPQNVPLCETSWPFAWLCDKAITQSHAKVLAKPRKEFNSFSQISNRCPYHLLKLSLSNCSHSIHIEILFGKSCFIFSQNETLLTYWSDFQNKPLVYSPAHPPHKTTYRLLRWAWSSPRTWYQHLSGYNHDQRAPVALFLVHTSAPARPPGFGIRPCPRAGKPFNFTDICCLAIWVRGNGHHYHKKYSFHFLFFVQRKNTPAQRYCTNPHNIIF